MVQSPIQPKKQTKKAVRVEVGDDREGGVGQNLKKGGVGNIEGLHKTEARNPFINYEQMIVVYIKNTKILQNLSLCLIRSKK